MSPLLRNIISVFCLIGACWSGLSAAQMQTVLQPEAQEEIVQQGTVPIANQPNTTGFGLAGLLFLLAVGLQLESAFAKRQPRAVIVTHTPTNNQQPQTVVEAQAIQPAQQIVQNQPIQPAQPQTQAEATTPTQQSTPPIITDTPQPATPAAAPNPATYAVAQPQPPQPEPQENILAKMAASPLGLVFTAPPGTGKTVTELAYLAKLFELYPDAIARVVCRKRDRFLGLASVPRCVEMIQGSDFEPLIDAINWLHGVLSYRLGQPASERSAFQKQPVRLVIGDYYSISNSLDQLRKLKDVWDEIKVKLGDVNTLGREVCVGATVDTHSFNVRALGVSDGNIRDCLNIAALGKINRNADGREDGGYGAIYKAINNKLVVDDDALRSKLLNQILPKLQQESDQTGQPVLFTTMGTPRLMLLPDLRWAENYTLPRETLQRLAQKLGTQLPDAA